MERTPKNDEGYPVVRGTTGLFYCGRHIGIPNLRDPGSDGYCGPTNGPQCNSCKLFQIASDPMLSLARQLLDLGFRSGSPARSPASSKTIPSRYRCNSCRGDIENCLRFHCTKCDDYDLCESCFQQEKSTDNHRLIHGMNIFREPGSVSILFICDSCKVKINGLRFRCSVCPSFDLCNSCYNRSKWPTCHLGTHQINSYYDLLKERTTAVTHMTYNCDVCQKEICGIRIHCNNCMNFDLCEQCYRARKTIAQHTYSHTISAFQEPSSVPLPQYSTSQISMSNVGVNPMVALIAASSRDPCFNETKLLFLNSWTKDIHVKERIVIRAICSVENSVLSGSYKIYKHKLSTSNIHPNKQKLWHGTGLQCDLFQNEFKTCHGSDCAVCNIVENNFILSRAQSNISFGRFGNGIYFSPCSSKSHDYNGKSERQGIRAMLLCKVLLGKSYISKDNMTNLMSPPYGFNSVTGEPGSVLNYPEVVIWEERAIVPQFVVFYSFS